MIQLHGDGRDAPGVSALSQEVEAKSGKAGGADGSCMASLDGDLQLERQFFDSGKEVSAGYSSLAQSLMYNSVSDENEK